jgi:putative ABC transport system permease protein
VHLPASYACRNLIRRPWRTLMTIAGVAVVVFAAVLMLAMSRGLAQRLGATGEEENLLAISRKGQNNMFSSITVDEVIHLLSMPGLAVSTSGSPLVSPELMHVPFVDVPTATGTVRAPISLRGVSSIAFEVHRSVRITSGRLPEASFEILAGSAAYSKLGVDAGSLAIGKTVSFESREWVVVGTFEASGSLFESELWASENDLMTVLKRRTHSFVVMRFVDAAAVTAATSLFEQSGAIERYFQGWPETVYYSEFVSALAWVKWLSVVMVVAVSVAGLLIGINTMYSAVMNRMGEIATQRVLGFSGFDIIVSFITEGLAISLTGGTIGVLFGFAIDNLPLNFSQGAFFLVVDAGVVATGMGLAAAVGIVGSLLPALKGVRTGILDALRHG